jgi:hypothetical protein
MSPGLRHKLLAYQRALAAVNPKLRPGQGTKSVALPGTQRPRRKTVADETAVADTA